ncbi:TPA: hypothetical protein ACQZHI_004549, partial [Escherichia coli]
MTNITDLLSTSTWKTISSYQTLARKAVEENKNPGVLAALERFFHKLEFLLKYGHVPSTDDVTGTNMPPELQGLKEFLNNSSRKAGDTYYLQRNETERYCFRWQNDEELDVAREKKSRTEVRSGCIREEWKRMTSENVTADLVWSILDCPSMDDSLKSLKKALTEFQKLRTQSNEPDKFVSGLTIKRSECGGAVAIHVNFCVNGESVRETSYSLSEKRLSKPDLKKVDLRGAG